MVLREIVSQSLGISSHSNSVLKFAESNGSGNRSDNKSPKPRWKNVSVGGHTKKGSIMQPVDDWQETSTFTGALEKIESWIFSRTVESVWWQVKLAFLNLEVILYCFVILSCKLWLTT